MSEPAMESSLFEDALAIFPAHHAEHAKRARRVVQKAPGAFLTIGEVAEQLHIEQHVLRFWEAKFPQIQPLKRAGARRYYRPQDVAIVTQIHDLLYKDGYTIKGAQKYLAEHATPKKTTLGLIKLPVDESHVETAMSVSSTIDVMQVKKTDLQNLLDALVRLRHTIAN